MLFKKGYSEAAHEEANGKDLAFRVNRDKKTK